MNKDNKKEFAPQGGGQMLKKLLFAVIISVIIALAIVSVALVLSAEAAPKCRFSVVVVSLWPPLFTDDYAFYTCGEFVIIAVDVLKKDFREYKFRVLTSELIPGKDWSMARIYLVNFKNGKDYRPIPVVLAPLN